MGRRQAEQVQAQEQAQAFGGAPAAGPAGGEARGAPARIPTDVLLGSVAFTKYQPDFLKALLTEPEYAEREARAIAEKHFGTGGA
ncbi:MAG: hypothetical protein LBJ10_03015 [Clostridiales bacterium]|jgi:hypothetical protein|nr:hypothetical protein [Clostridiales bacterium]